MTIDLKTITRTDPTPRRARTPVSLTRRHPDFPAPKHCLFNRTPRTSRLNRNCVILSAANRQPCNMLCFPNSSFSYFRNRIRNKTLTVAVVDTCDRRICPCDVTLTTGAAITSNRLTDNLTPVDLRNFCALNNPDSGSLEVLRVYRRIISRTS